MRASAFIFIVSAWNVLAAEICPTGFTFDGDDLCHKALEGPYFSYDEADSHCRVFGGEVACIVNDFQFNIIKAQVQPNYYYFTAAKRISDTVYVCPRGQRIEKKYWLPGQPVVGGGPCTSFFKNVTVAGLLADDCTIPRIDHGVVCQAAPIECSPNVIENSQHGTIFSVNYPNHYFNDINCTYTLRAGANQVVTLIFTDFRVEDVWDYVNVYDGSINGKLLAKITVSTSNKMVQSKSSTMVVQFVTDSDTYNIGWKADYYMGTAPSPVVKTISAGIVTSPNYPSNYPQNITQIYNLNYNSQYFHYALNFTNFATYWNDYVAIYEGGSLWKMTDLISGVYTTPKSYTTSTSNIMLVFSTGAEKGYAG